MFSMIRRRLTYANVAMTLALVFAMAGGAYAAKKFIITSKSQIKPSVWAQLKGKNGANGTNGTNGAPGLNGKDGVGSQGPQGPQGPQGEKGLKGDTGSVGPTGATGTTGKEGPTGKEGATGTTGATGSPWTASGTLPPGKTETGTWSYGEVPAGTNTYIPLSFSIPLDPAKAVPAIFFTRPTWTYKGNPAGPEWFDADKFGLGSPKALEGAELLEAETACPGSNTAPEAEPGFLCIYTTFLGTGVQEEPEFLKVGTKAAGWTGAILVMPAEIGRGRRMGNVGGDRSPVRPVRARRS